MNDRILFIIPPNIDFDSFTKPNSFGKIMKKSDGEYGNIVTDMPIGILSLSSYIKKHTNVEVRLIDFNTILNNCNKFSYNSFTEFFNDILFQDNCIGHYPTIVGISTLFTSSYFNMIDISNEVKKIYPNALCIAGGGIPTVMYKEIFKESNAFDGLCFGEGEKPIVELLKVKDKKTYLENSTSWVTSNSIDKNLYHKFIDDLDEIPFYDYSILDLENYQKNLTAKTFTDSDNNNLYHISTTRGCMMKCSFCASHRVHGRQVRYHSLNRVKNDLQVLKDKYNCSMISIQDDHFMVDKKRAIEIIKFAKSLDMKLFFQSGLALYTLDRKTLGVLKDCGVDRIVLASESGSEKVLKKIMHKPINLNIIRRVVKDCRELGIETDANILIGLPGETKQDIEDSFQFLKSIDATWYRIFIATPLPGSEMFDICVENNYIKGNHIGSDFKNGIIETEDFTAEWIKNKAYEINLLLNFVYNSDMQLGNYKKALEGFQNTIKVTSDHAIAYYYATICCKKLNLRDLEKEYKRIYNKIVIKSEYWKKIMGNIV